MTKAKLVYWSGTLFLFCIAKSSVSLAVYSFSLGNKASRPDLQKRTWSIATTLVSQHILTDAVKHSGDYDEVSRPYDVISG